MRLSYPGNGDGSLFVDDDGTGYYIYTSIREGYTIHIERLTPDYLGVTGESSSVLAVGGEAPVLFRRNRFYYALFRAFCAFFPRVVKRGFSCPNHRWALLPRNLKQTSIVVQKTTHTHVVKRNMGRDHSDTFRACYCSFQT